MKWYCSRRSCSCKKFHCVMFFEYVLTRAWKLVGRSVKASEQCMMHRARGYRSLNTCGIFSLTISLDDHMIKYLSRILIISSHSWKKLVIVPELTANRYAISWKCKSSQSLTKTRKNWSIGVNYGLHGSRENWTHKGNEPIAFVIVCLLVL